LPFKIKQLLIVNSTKNLADFQRKKATLLLADGTVFYGKAIGKLGTTTGEICFNTGMTGYQEIFIMCILVITE
jgi:hypothetical protein